MNRFDSNSAKFISIIIGICFIFIMVVWHAFDYIPKNETKNYIPEIAQEQNIDDAENNEDKNLEAKEEKLEDIVENVKNVDFEKKDTNKTKL